MNYKDLPDFCNQDVLLNSMIMAEIIAIMLTVVQPIGLFEKIQYLTVASMVIQWILVINLFVLCKTQKYLAQLSVPVFYVTTFFLLQFVTFIVSSSSNVLIDYLDLGFMFENNWQQAFVLQNLLISSLLSIMLIRYAYLNTRWRNQVIAQTQSKIDSLQARIRPHFLFNSLNTIAALIHINPQKADDAILGLADIFRTSIGNQTMVTLKDEIETVKKYLALEKLRLNERLQVNWHIVNKHLNVTVPALILQPLVENAVYHGIEQLETGGEITISMNIQNSHLVIVVENPINLFGQSTRAGNNTALVNIKERLKLIYPNSPSFEYSTNSKASTFTATLNIPL